MPSWNEPTLEEVAAALNTYFAAETEDDVRRVLERYRKALLTNRAVTAIKGRILNLRSQRNVDHLGSTT